MTFLSPTLSYFSPSLRIYLVVWACFIFSCEIIHFQIDLKWTEYRTRRQWKRKKNSIKHLIQRKFLSNVLINSEFVTSTSLNFAHYARSVESTPCEQGIRVSALCLWHNRYWGSALRLTEQFSCLFFPIYSRSLFFLFSLCLSTLDGICALAVYLRYSLFPYWFCRLWHLLIHSFFRGINSCRLDWELIHMFQCGWLKAWDQCLLEILCWNWCGYRFDRMYHWMFDSMHGTHTHTQ